jgi:hypothetical protein
MPRVPVHMHALALGMLQGGLRTVDVARAINCTVCTVRHLRQSYRETGRTADCHHSGRLCLTSPAQDRYIQTSHLRDRYRMATTAAQVTPGTHNLTISLVVIVGNLNAVRYREDILLPHVVPFLQAHPDMTLQHDNATSHTACSVCDLLQDRNISVLPRPARSPDLNLRLGPVGSEGEG